MARVRRLAGNGTVSLGISFVKWLKPQKYAEKPRFLLLNHYFSLLMQGHGRFYITKTTN
jgi:hypothetical protein